MLPVDFAVKYAQAGYVVLPLEPGKKIPHKKILTYGWSFTDVGSSEVETVRSWWRRDKAANIGVVHGPRSGILVIDVDVKKGNGFESLATWKVETGLELPSTFNVTTPSGGEHLWYRIPRDRDGTPFKKLGWIPNVDFLMGGGFMVVPPSAVSKLHPSQPSWSSFVEYRWKNFGGDVPNWEDLPEVSTEVIEDARRREPTVTVDDGSVLTLNLGDTLPHEKFFRANGFGRYEGSRDRECFRLSRRLFGQLNGNEAAVRQTILEIFHQVNTEKQKVTTHGLDPFTEGDVEKCIQSAKRYFLRAEQARRAREDRTRSQPTPRSHHAPIEEYGL